MKQAATPSDIAKSPQSLKNRRWALRREYEQLVAELPLNLREQPTHSQVIAPSFSVSAKLPVEILAIILTLAEEAIEDCQERYRFPETYQLVCRRWRYIIRGTPQLWTYFDNTSPSKHFAFSVRLRKSGNCPIRIALSVVDLYELRAILDLFWPITERWESLTISWSMSVEWRYSEESLPAIDFYNQISTQQSTSPPSLSPSSAVSPYPRFTRLRQLDLRGPNAISGLTLFSAAKMEQISIHVTFQRYSPVTVLAILQSMPHLKHVELATMHPLVRGFDSLPPRSRVELLQLTSLTLRKLQDIIAFVIISSINAPNLSLLVLDSLAGSSQDSWDLGLPPWDFPRLYTLHLIRFTSLVAFESWQIAIGGLHSVRHITFTTFDMRFFKWGEPPTPAFGPFLLPALSFISSRLETLTVRGVALPMLVSFVQDVAHSLKRLIVHAEDITLSYDDAAARKRMKTMEIEVKELRAVIKFDVNHAYDENDCVPVRRRFSAWEERAEWQGPTFNYVDRTMQIMN